MRTINTQSAAKRRRECPSIQERSPFLIVAFLLFSVLLLGFVPQSSAQASRSPSAEKESKNIMCMWNAFGQKKYMCSKEGMKKAQEQCDKKATAQRKEKTSCSCTDDPNYIQDMC